MDKVKVAEYLSEESIFVGDPGLSTLFRLTAEALMKGTLPSAVLDVIEKMPVDDASIFEDNPS